MKGKFLKALAASAAGLLSACAIITVNVYFPEKDVKQAYKSLDEMLLHQNPEKAPAPAPEGSGKEEVKPQSRLLPAGFSISLVSEAFAAQEGAADELAIELSNMPEVLKAYEDMRGRLARLNELRDAGIVGETSQGLVTVRDKSRIGGDEALVRAENDSRKTVMVGMAKAMMKVAKKESAKIPPDVMRQAVSVYAATRQEAAKKGWWVQGADGTWKQK